jgi:hypothetical protein
MRVGVEKNQDVAGGFRHSGRQLMAATGSRLNDASQTSGQGSRAVTASAIHDNQLGLFAKRVASGPQSRLYFRFFVESRDDH